MIETFFKLVIGHAVGDFWAQSDGMRKAKGWKNKVLSDDVLVWPYALTAHSLMHGGIVYFITGSAWLGLAETICHWCIDYCKCSGFFKTQVDQSLHISCKFIWAALA